MAMFLGIMAMAVVLGGCRPPETVEEVIVLAPQADKGAIEIPLLDAVFYEKSIPDSKYILLTSNGKAGIANQKGEIILQPEEYSAVEIRTPYILGVRDGEIDFLNMSGKKLNAAKVSGISYFFEGKAFTIVENKYYWLYENGTLERVEFESEPQFLEKYNSINYAGNENMLSQYGYIAYMDNGLLKIMSFSGELIEAAITPDKIGMHNGLIYFGNGAINTQGEVVIPFEYDDLIPAGETGFIVKKGSKFGIVNNSGEVLLPCEFINFKEITGNLAVFETNDIKKNGVMSLAGEIVLQPEYELIYIGEGRIVGRKSFGNSFVFALDGTQIPFSSSFTPDGGFNSGLVPVMNDNMKRGFADLGGNVVVLCEYDEVAPFSDGYASVKKDGKWGVVDKNGNMIIGCKYDKIRGPFFEMEGKWYYINYREEIK